MQKRSKNPRAHNWFKDKRIVTKRRLQENYLCEMIIQYFNKTQDCNRDNLNVCRFINIHAINVTDRVQFVNWHFRDN